MPAQAVLNALVEVAANQTEPGSYEIHQYTRTSVSKIYKYLLKNMKLNIY